MEIIDVLKRLNEISEREIIEKHGGEHSTSGREMTSGEMGKREKIVKGMKKDKAGFKKRYGADADAVMYATATKQAMKDDETNEGGMSDIMVGAEEAIGDYIGDDGNLKMPKRLVIQDLMQKAKEAPMPTSYELETAAKMVDDKFNDDGDANEGQTDEGNAFAQAVQQAKAAGMKKGDKFKVGDEEHTLRDSDFEKVNTNTMETKDKKDVKEDMHITTDSPQEASMLMQILKMAGVKPVDASMMGMEPEHGSQMDPGAMNKQMDVPGDDAMGSMQMAKMRDMMMKPDMEKAEENFANSEKEAERDLPKTLDTDNLVNVQSGGLNRQKQQFRKEHPGDNPMAVEDKITEQDLANSLRTQYESFKQSYQDEAKFAEKQGTDHDKDGDIDSKDYLKSRDIAIKKAMAKKD